MKTRFFIVAGAIASAVAVAGCKQEVQVPEPVRPVLSTVLQPAASASTIAVGTVQPRYEANLGFRVLGRLIASSQRRRSGRRGADDRHNRLDRT